MGMRVGSTGSPFIDSSDPGPTDIATFIKTLSDMESGTTSFNMQTIENQFTAIQTDATSIGPQILGQPIYDLVNVTILNDLNTLASNATSYPPPSSQVTSDLEQTIQDAQMLASQWPT